jgi:DNA-binding NarL/FixJ family response regulator
VVIAEDKPHEVHGFIGLLKYAPQVEVVGNALQWYHIIHEVVQKKPDVLMLDLHWHEDEELIYPVIAELRQRAPQTAILAMSSYPQCVARAKGVKEIDGVVNKAQLNDIEPIVAHLQQAFQAHHGSSEITLWDCSLSRREQEVLGLLRQGKTNKEIAKELGIAQTTVKTHTQKVYAKLEVSSRAEAIVKTQGWKF